MHSRIRGIGMTSQRTRERLVQRLKQEGICNPAVLEVIRSTPRHLFVDEALASRAYEDTALPIGYQQTISQPWVVAKMTELLIEDGIPQKVLEVGTGSGYQTAVLASLVPRLYSVERISELATQARKLIRELGFRNVRIQHSDGNEGWDRYGPFNGILVTAAPSDIPHALLEQLADGGRMILPVGDKRSQRLVVVTRNGQTFERSDREAVVFVPLQTGAV